MSIGVVQSNRKRDGEDRWDWEVHLEGNKEELGEVEYVEYTLHETFPNPVRRKYDQSSGFKLETSGWGTSFCTLGSITKKKNEETTIRRFSFASTNSPKLPSCDETVAGKDKCASKTSSRK